MSHQEVKASFSWQYLILTIFTAGVISIVGIGVAKYFESKPTKELILYEGRLSNLINDDALPEDQIEANFFLKGDPKKKIESLFQKSFTVKNVGNEGVENLEITFAVEEKDAFLVDKPRIETEPKDIIKAISATKNKNLSNNKKHVWNISLLNRGESIIFKYSVYSERRIDNISFSALPRKKDWTISRRSLLTDKMKRITFIEYLISVPVFMILLLLLPLLLAIPIYRIEWNKNPEVREKYETFYRYYSTHYPPPIKELFQ